MSGQPQQGRGQALIQEMGLTESDLDRRRKAVGLEPSDLPRLAAIRDVVVPEVEAYTATFFDHLSGLEGTSSFLANTILRDRARLLKREHLMAIVSGDYGMRYAEQRLELASVYSTAGLDIGSFLGAFHRMLRDIGTAILKRFQKAPLDGFDNFMSLKKIAFFDIGLIIDVLVFERERLIRQQQEAIRELSTPVLQVREGMLLLPIIGVMDTLRARLITDSLLRSIHASRARVVVMDITGVGAIDSRVANHLIQTVAAARLMGAHVIVSGLSAGVAQSLVGLGVDLRKLNTVGDLQGGVEAAQRLLA